VWRPSQVAAERVRKRKSGYHLQLNLWGLVSIMVALLFLFIGDTTPDQHPSPPVDLPAAQNAVPQPSGRREDAMRVSVTRDGRIFFGDSEISRSQLADRVSTALREGSERKVYLSADVRARYADVKVALDQIRSAGVTDVVVLAWNAAEREKLLNRSSRAKPFL
jgi:biopolymer transport protein ExbD